MAAQRNDVVKWCLGQGLARSGRGNLKLPLAAQGEPRADGTLRVVMTTDAVDRHGDILEPGGADLRAFRKSPRVQWAHDYTKPPIGRAEEVAREGDTLTCRIAWWQGADAGSDHARFVREVRAMYEHQPPFLNTWSIGFMPLEWTERTAADADGKETFTGYHITKWELLELSAVPVPANPEAVSALHLAGIVTHKGLAKSLGLKLSPETSAPSGRQAQADSPERRLPLVQADALAADVREAVRHRLAETLRRAACARLDRRRGRVTH